MTPLSEQVDRQLRFIEASASEFDAGNRDEAIRIATCLRVLCHQTLKSTSLLRHLNAEGISVCSTSAGTPVSTGLGLNVANNLITNPFTGDMRAAPWLSDAPQKNLVPFSIWWQGEVVIFNSGIEITRKALCLWAANQDGGAHVDDSPHADYQFVQRGLDFTFTITHEGGHQLIAKPAEVHLAALRQFGWEVLSSPDVLRLAGRSAP